MNFKNENICVHFVVDALLILLMQELCICDTYIIRAITTRDSGARLSNRRLDSRACRG